MVSLDALAAYLRQQDPNNDWAATLVGFNATRGVPATPNPTPEIPITESQPTTLPTSSTPTSKITSPTEPTPPIPSNPSPEQPHIEPLDVSPLSAYQDPELGMTEEKGDGEEASGEERNKLDEIPVKKPKPQEKEREEIDLNETARKQGLMTDDEFQQILEAVTGREERTAEMAEGLDLASKAVGGRGPSEPAQEPETEGYQPVGEEEKQMEEEGQEPEQYQSEIEESPERAQEEKEAETQPARPTHPVPSVSKAKSVQKEVGVEERNQGSRAEAKENITKMFGEVDFQQGRGKHGRKRSGAFK